MLRKGLTIFIALMLTLCAALPLAASEEGDALLLIPVSESGETLPLPPQDEPPQGVQATLPPVELQSKETESEPTTGSANQGLPEGHEIPPEDAQSDEEGGDTHHEDEQTPLADLNAVLIFWQAREVELHYWWDEQAQMWKADPLALAEVPVFVTNTSDAPVGPIRIIVSSAGATDEGGLFTMECTLLPEALGLVLAPGESVQVAVLSFAGIGGETRTAEPGQLAIELSAEYKQITKN